MFQKECMCVCIRVCACVRVHIYVGGVSMLQGCAQYQGNIKGNGLGIDLIMYRLMEVHVLKVIQGLMF